jgi:hypothetical protein
MAMRITIAVSVILVIAAIGLWATSQQHSVLEFQPSESANVPPGVLAEMWLPINATAGVALNVQGPPPGTKMPERGLLAYGTLMIKSDGVWQKVYLETVPEITEHKFMPAR